MRSRINRRKDTDTVYVNLNAIFGKNSFFTFISQRNYFSEFLTNFSLILSLISFYFTDDK